MLPDPLAPLVAAALSEMQADPQHRLAPSRRREIYAALAGAPDPALRLAPCWLAILAARRVLPLFQQRCPDDKLPAALLAAAIAVLAGRLNDATAADLEAQGYQASRNAWGYQADDLPWPVGLAADAAYYALKEARGYQPLNNIDAYLQMETVEWSPGPEPARRRVPPLAEGAQTQPFGDETLCQMDNNDTAASAHFGPTCDPARLEAFWTWWLREAVPAAVAAARRAGLA